MTHLTGIIPGVGDAADAVLGYVLVIRKARKAEYVSPPSSTFSYVLTPCPRFLSHRIPSWLTQRMILNLALATTVGLVPLVGDVMLAAFRANSRNAALLEEFLRLRGEKGTRTTGETGASAERGITLRGEPRAAHEAGQDTDDVVMEPVERKRSRLGLFDTDKKGKGTSALPEGPQVAQHRDSRFVEDVS